MDLTLSDEQRLLRESAERFVAETYNADHRRRLASDPLGFSSEIWKQFADLGWLALPIPEAYDGLGGGAVEIGILMEAFGRGLVSEPYLSTVVIGAALIAGDGDSPGKLCLFLVPADAPGLVRRDFPRLGGGRACNLDLRDISLSADALLGDGADALPAIEAVVDRAMAAMGAEAVGIMQTLLEQTLEYTKIRKQFGRPLSANQVIRHRLADMAMQCDEARSMALRAALMVGAEPVARSRAASGAKAKIGKCARFVAEQSVQLHGAMGVTEELDIGSYFKRLLAFDTMFGGSAHHYLRHAALGGRAS